ncbi:MAG TPA: cytochrome c [Candidatus Sulfotelmatobacter sp.]|nr:cytochrome c [Candidatus Sulfotelmatobacter sp.]
MSQFSRAALVAALSSAALLTGALLRPSGSGAAPAAPALYTAGQAATGAAVYAGKCALCHGAALEGGAGPPLSGPNLTTLGTKTHLTVGDMFGYITTNMPFNDPGSLSHDQYVAALAYILKQNGYPAGSTALTWASANASKVLVRSYK